MPIAIYGNYGFALLLVPTAAADYLEYERFQLMDTLAPFIDGGKVKVFSINSINSEATIKNLFIQLLQEQAVGFGDGRAFTRQSTNK